MRYLSLFSGIEAATAAWAPLGWECAAVSDIDPFACAYLKQCHPEVPNLGDVTLITESDIAALGAIDLVVFGSPCQDLSVAGKRKGLDGERSGLFFAAMRIVEWARKHGGCRFALWENVPGAFSSNSGGDFAVVVGQMAGCESLDVPPKGWGTEGAAIGSQGMVEWSVLDAQWFGVAQRRRRVFALADFGDWASRPPILLEPESLRGDSAPSREAGQGASRGFETGPSGGSFTDVAPTLDCRAKNGPIQNQLGAGVFTAVSVALRGREGGGTAELGGPVSGTLRASGGGGDKQHVLVGVQRPVRVAEPIICAATGQAGAEITTDYCSTLNCNHEAPYVAYGLLAPCEFCGYPFDESALGRYGCPNCEGGGLDVQCVTGQVTHTLKADGFDASEDGTGRGTPIVPWATGVTIHGTDGCAQVASYSDTSQCLRARTPGNIENSSTTVVLQTLPVAFSENQRGEVRTSDVFGALGCGGGKPGMGYPAVVYPIQNATRGKSQNGLGVGFSKDSMYTLDQGSQHAVAFQSSQSGVRLGDVHATPDSNNGVGMQVRRLTPTECERLQGFPDCHTAITVRGKPAADGPRYKALGNSMAVPVMHWIGKQIDDVVMFY